MNIRLMLSLFLALVVSSCTTVGTIHRSECNPGPHGLPREIPITIVYTPNGIVDPGTRCARPGDVLKFKLRGKPGVFVSVESSETGGEWLRGRGKMPEKAKEGVFWVPVPLTAIPPESAGKDFKYTIKATGLDDLDPVVRVKHTY